MQALQYCIKKCERRRFALVFLTLAAKLDDLASSIFSVFTAMGFKKNGFFKDFSSMVKNFYLCKIFEAGELVILDILTFDCVMQAFYNKKCWMRF